MRNYFKYIIFFTILLLQISCICDCVENGGYIKLKLIKNGHNALFGPDANINRDSIQLFMQNNNGYEEFISFNDSTKTIDLFIGNQLKYVLRIDNIRTDTIIGSTVVSGTGQCGCSSYQFSNVKMNGQIICQDGCDEIIEVQL